MVAVALIFGSGLGIVTKKAFWEKVSELLTFARCLPWGKMCGGLLAQYMIADLTATVEKGEKNHHLKMKNMRVEETCPRPCSIWW